MWNEIKYYLFLFGMNLMFAGIIYSVLAAVNMSNLPDLRPRDKMVAYIFMSAGFLIILVAIFLKE